VYQPLAALRYAALKQRPVLERGKVMAGNRTDNPFDSIESAYDFMNTLADTVLDAIYIATTRSPSGTVKAGAPRPSNSHCSKRNH
jgi:hypothetical protein